MSLTPPFIGQERAETCALACLRLMLAHFGLADIAEEILARDESLTEGGANPDQLVRIAEKFAINASAQQLDLPASKSLVGRRFFPIVYIDRLPIDGEFSIHAVIPIRFGRRLVKVLDPLRGPRQLPIQKFRKSLRRVGWTVVC